MDKHMAVAAALLALSVLACNAPLPRDASAPPTNTPMTVKPTVAEVPPTESPPTESPTETPTTVKPTSTRVAEGPTPTPSPTQVWPTMEPSSTPMVMCTPPLCSDGEVYYCDGECPGGCGTQCATPTPQPPGLPTILSFTADRTNIVQGDSVALTWQASGGEEVHICWVTHEAIMACLPGPLDPNGGTESIAPTAPGRPGHTDMMLSVVNEAGSAKATVELTIECAEDPLPALEDQGLLGNCPYDTVVGDAAYQSFEGGHMIWVEGNRTVYVLYSDGQYRSYTDDFQEGDPESDPSIVPPEGLYQPVRGFGLVWRTNPDVRDRLGWAMAPEVGFSGWSQSYTGSGMHNSATFLQFIDGSTVLLSHFGGMWRFFE